ncbi:MAG: glycosyltransferase family 2 protein [Ruminococcaceae bacterium]|nr:glycosyltransferase family 2 protein [Oscillospiraceae bacterium]MBR3597388.1 glycosyltransferase family 2 protein [Clostridia bacterium]
MIKKTVSVVVPIFNEKEMLDEIFSRVDAVFQNNEKYEYELVFFDDGSTDGTRKNIEKLCSHYENVKGVFYAKNAGYLKNTFYCVQQAKGDCVIILHADLQNPPEKIPEFLEKWENGAQVVLGVKKKSRENRFMFFLRSVFYFLMIHIFGIKLTPHATEFELFDKSFVEILKKIKPSNPFLRGIILEYASSTDVVYFTQDMRKKGKSKFNLNKYYDFAICGIVQYSVNIPRRVILCSFAGIILMFVELFLLWLPKMISDGFADVENGLIIRILIFLVLLLFVFLSFILEYIIFLIKNADEKPLVLEEKRINY